MNFRARGQCGNICLLRHFQAPEVLNAKRKKMK